MSRFTPTRLIKLFRACLPFMAAMLLGILAGCGGGQATSISPAADSSVDKSAEFGLPSPHELIEGGLRSTSLTSDPDPQVAGDAYVFSGGDVIIPEPGIAQITAPADGMAYAVFQFSDLAEADKLLSVTVDATTVDTGADFEYYLLYADYEENSWKTAALQLTPGVRTMEIENPGGEVSGVGTAYVALVAYDSAALKAISVTAHFSFMNRNAPDHIVSSLPGRDAVGVDIRFQLEAVDEAGLTMLDYNGPATISSAPLGMAAVGQPLFVAGFATATANFGSPGGYSLVIGGVGEQATGVIDTIIVHETALPVYEIEISEADLASLDADPWSDEYFSADATLEGQQFPSIRVRYRGGVTRNMPKKSWKVKLNKTEKYLDPDWGYENKTLNLNAEYSDPTLLRDKLCYDMFQDFGVLSPRARFVHLRVNGVFQGVYTQVEQPRTDWLVSLGTDPDGPLYEAKASNLEELPLPADYHTLFDKELNDLEPFDDLAGFISGFNNWPAPDFHDEFEATVDAENYLNYFLVNMLVSQGDHIMKNYMLYLDELDTGKWYIVAWDNDLTWGHHWDEELGLFNLAPSYGLPLDYGSFSSSWSGGTWGNHLMDRWLADPLFYAEYEAALADALDNYFTEAEFIGRVDAAFAQIHPDALADTQKYTDGIEYIVWVEELREYVRQRRVFLAGALE